MTQTELILKPIDPEPGSDEAKTLAAIKAKPEGITTGELIRSCYVACITKAITRLRRHGWPITTHDIEGQRQKLYTLEENCPR